MAFEAFMAFGCGAAACLAFFIALMAFMAFMGAMVEIGKSGFANTFDCTSCSMHTNTNLITCLLSSLLANLITCHHLYARDYFHLHCLMHIDLFRMLFVKVGAEQPWEFGRLGLNNLGKLEGWGGTTLGNWKVGEDHRLASNMF